MSRYHTGPGTIAATSTLTDFNGGREGGIVWKPEEFTRLRITSTKLKNKHCPPHPIAYELIPTLTGTARQYGEREVFTQRDFWVTRDRLNEMRFKDVPQYANGEKLNGRLVIWHHSSLLHRPRSEDFGQNGYGPYQGVAGVSWARVDLKPRNLFSRSPFYTLSEIK